MKAAVLSEYRKIQWQEVKKPEITDSEVLVRVSYAGICGSDQHVFNGDFHPRTTLPLIQGHEFAGTIVKVGKNVTGFKQGDRVTVDPIFWCGECAACGLGHFPACKSLKLLGIDVHGGFGEYVTVKDFMSHKIEPNISDKHAALIEVLSIGFHACNRAGLKKNDTVAIFGAGKVGQSILQAAHTMTQNTIFMVDILKKRLEIAKKTYPHIYTINAQEEDPVAVIVKLTDERGVDVAFEAVGHAHSIPNRFPPVRQCVQSIRGGGTVCVLGLADEPVPMLMKEIIFKEGKIVASRVTHGEFEKTIQQMSMGHLNPDALISCEIPANRTQEAFELLENEPENYLKILLRL